MVIGGNDAIGENLDHLQFLATEEVWRLFLVRGSRDFQARERGRHDCTGSDPDQFPAGQLAFACIRVLLGSIRVRRFVKVRIVWHQRFPFLNSPAR